MEATIGKQVLTDEGLRTLMSEAELCVNSRPLSVLSTDEEDYDVLTPLKLLTLADSPPVWGSFTASDTCSKKLWRHVQFIADQFWRRWCKEYRNTLQERRKWHGTRDNCCIGDLVLVVDENEARCHWPLGRVTAVYSSADGLVRSVQVFAKGKQIRRPVTKLVSIMKNEDMM